MRKEGRKKQNSLTCEKCVNDFKKKFLNEGKTMPMVGVNVLIVYI